MKNFIIIGIVIFALISCSSSKSAIISKRNDLEKISDTVRIANDDLKYEVIIIDSGYSTWIASQARPRGFYSESFLEDRNKIYAQEWNSRVLQPQKYDANLYEMQINYDNTIHYGYEVNYLIYNYFIFFQITYKQQLSGFVPRP